MSAIPEEDPVEELIEDDEPQEDPTDPPAAEW